MKNYTIISMPTVAEMETEVEKALNQGYKLLGGVSVTKYEKEGVTYTRFAQAMVLATASNRVA